MIAEGLAWLRQEAVPLGLAVLMHVALGALLILSSGFITASPQDAPGRGTEHEPIQAVVVKESDYQAAKQQIEATDKAKQERVEALNKQAAAALAAQKKAEQKLARIKQQQDEAARQAAARQAQLADLKRQTDAAAKKKEAEQAAAREAEARAAAARKAREAEEARAAKTKAEATAKAKEKAEAAAKAKAAAERKARMEAAMKAEAEQRLKRVQGNWVAAIRATVTGNWIRPLSAPKDLDCRVRITQLTNGEVIGAEILDCNADAAVQQSIRSAIYKSSPLPTPSDPAAFERQIIFDFNPGGDN